MKNQSFNYSSLARCFNPSDFFYDQQLRKDDYRKNILQEALSISENLFNSGITLEKFELRKKECFRIPNISEKLVLRKCAYNLSICTRPKIKHRNLIAQELKIFLKEGTAYRIYRLDIKSFFESVDVESVKTTISAIENLSTHTKNILYAYLNEFKENYGNGIPRGVEISPILAEIILKNFDDFIKYHQDVFYYARFVDDILIITSSKENEIEFFRLIQKNLPYKLYFNYDKRKIITVSKRGKSTSAPNGTVVGSFEFLGYVFTIIDTKIERETERAIYRKVKIDISEKKVKIIKEKIARSLLNNSKNTNFQLLLDRLTFLVTNRELKDKNKNRLIPTGVYYNYSRIDTDSKRLSELDSYLKNMVLSKNGRFGNKIHGSLNKEQKKTILKLSFIKGFNERVHKRFSPNRLKEITEIWL